MTGEVNSGAGFPTCLRLFESNPRRASQVIILFTDGKVIADEALLLQLAKVSNFCILIWCWRRDKRVNEQIGDSMQNNVRVFTFGVGIHEHLKSSIVSFSEHAIFVADFGEMQQIVSQLHVLPSAPPNINLRTRSTQKASFDIIYAEPFKSMELKLLEPVSPSTSYHLLNDLSLF